MIDISIITPVMNGAHYIRRCIDNVQSQRMGGIEHIIADGGSTDGTIEIVKKYIDTSPQIRLLEGPDKGQSDAINKATAASRGRIIGLLNVDDYYEPGVLHKVLSAFNDYPAPFILVGDCNVWNEDRTLLYVNRPRYLSLRAFLMGFPYPVNPSAYFYHRDLHDAVGGYDIEENYAMDLDFLCAVGCKAHFIRIKEVLGNFCMEPGSKTVLDKQQKMNKERTISILNKYTSHLSATDRILIHFLKPLVIFGRRVCGRLTKMSKDIFRIGGCN